MLTIYPLPWLGLPHIPRPRTPLSPYDLFKPFQSGCIITFVPCSLDRTHSQPTLSSYFIYLAQSIIASSINRLFSSPFSLIVDLLSLLFVSHCIHTPPHASNLRLAHRTHTSFDLHHSPYLPQHISPFAIFGTYVQYCNIFPFLSFNSFPLSSLPNGPLAFNAGPFYITNNERNHAIPWVVIRYWVL